MKKIKFKLLPLFLLTVALATCGHHNKDASNSAVKQHESTQQKPKNPMDKNQKNSSSIEHDISISSNNHSSNETSRATSKSTSKGKKHKRYTQSKKNESLSKEKEPQEGTDTQEKLDTKEKSNPQQGSNTQEKDTTPTKDKVMTTTKVKDTKNFYGIEFTEDSEIFTKIKGKSYKDNCTVPVSDLRYLHVLHTGFDGQTHEGEIICNKYIAEDLLEIFEALYEAQYPIEKIRLVDEYNAEDEASMADNNSSSFNFRFISYTKKISKHGYGLAMDINTLYNPYVKTVNGNLSIEPANAADYVDRTKDFPHKIDENDLAYKLFTAHGFEWGGAWKNSKDYQHFEVPDSVLKKLY